MTAPPQWFTVRMDVRMLPQEAAHFGHELRSLIQGSRMPIEYQFSGLTIEPWPPTGGARDDVDTTQRGSS